MERKKKGRHKILSGNDEKLRKLYSFMELNILGGASVVHILT